MRGLGRVEVVEVVQVQVRSKWRLRLRLRLRLRFEIEIEVRAWGVLCAAERGDPLARPARLGPALVHGRRWIWTEDL